MSTSTTRSRARGYWLPLLLALCLLIQCAAVPAMAETAEAATYRTDFYAAVNADWLASAEIPDDKYVIGGFGDLIYEVRDTLMADFTAMVADKTVPDDPRLAEFLKLYELAEDFDTRNADGLTALAEYLKPITSLTSLADLQSHYAELALAGATLPFDIVPDQDLADPNAKAIYFAPPSLILPDPAYYAEDNAAGAYLLSMYADTTRQLFVLAGYSDEEAAAIMNEAVAFDALLVPTAMDAEAQSNIANLYNPRNLSELAASIKNMDIITPVTELFGTAPDQVVVLNTKFTDAMDSVVSEENFPLIRSWMVMNQIRMLAKYTSEEAMELLAAYVNVITGQSVSTPKDQQAYTDASGMFSEVVGLYYAHEYFGEQAKADVTAMVENMIEVYRQRIQSNDWLESATKERAIRKLDTMTLRIGYPDRIDPLYDDMKIVGKAEGGTFIGNMDALYKQTYAEVYRRYTEPNDKELWDMSADTVNAGYNAAKNMIQFPAAILQAPFYSLDQTPSENYGGIGAVIAHEISHAFDPNGAQFDENGGMVNWWTEADYEQFTAKAQLMAEVFDGLPFAGTTVNGQLTVTENVADAGGLACALQVVKSLPEYDLSEFFINFARIWRSVARPEYQQLLITIDVHAPDKLRANVQLGLVDEFYEVFGVQEGDPMYRAPEDRVKIW
ncbi:peptidase M13 [Clostridia bacterium]|nr:peptidase M13 [Clostridia bacterium]